MEKVLCVFIIWCADIVTISSEGTGTHEKRYKAQWNDLDTRPLPEWYDRAKIGIMIHWGVYSVSGYHNEWFWKSLKQGNKNLENVVKLYRPGFNYQELAPMFTAEFFDPLEWASLFKKAGARYVILTSKHHDGYTLFPSETSFSWNSVDVGPHRDLVKELSSTVKSYGMEFGLYYSLMEWYNPLYLQDRKSRQNDSTKTNRFIRNKVWPELNQIISNYEPTILWTDGDWKDPIDYWNPTPIIAWLYNDSPVREKVVINDRWGIGSRCQHGDIYTCDDTKDPKTLPTHKWEHAFTMDKQSWGYRKNMQLSDIITMEELISTIVITVSNGGNALINIGPTKEGIIPLIFQAKLLELGKWLDDNKEAIYNTSPWMHQQDKSNPDVWYTCTKTTSDTLNSTASPNGNETVTAIYAIMLKFPKDGKLRLQNMTPEVRHNYYKSVLLDSPSTYLHWRFENDEIISIQLPEKGTLKSNYAWVLKFTSK